MQYLHLTPLQCGWRFFGVPIQRNRCRAMLLAFARCLKNQCLDSSCSPMLTGLPCKCRADPAFEILMLPLFDTTSQDRGSRRNGGLAGRSRDFHPSEDLSELPPLLVAVAGQEYHCLQTRSRQNSLPKLLLDG